MQPDCLEDGAIAVSGGDSFDTPEPSARWQVSEHWVWGITGALLVHQRCFTAAFPAHAASRCRLCEARAAYNTEKYLLFLADLNILKTLFSASKIFQTFIFK